MNTELFKKIDDIISADPGKLWMPTWESRTLGYCGTTRCVAGWAVYLTTGEPLYDGDDVSPATKDLLQTYGSPHIPDFTKIGAALLGLNLQDASRLFLSVSGETAAKFVHLAAVGCDDEALALLHPVDDGF